MKLRANVLSLGFGLSAILCASTAPTDDDSRPRGCASWLSGASPRGCASRLSGASPRGCASWLSGASPRGCASRLSGASPPARVYTNEDLDRVRPLRDQTGVYSVPAVAPDDRPSPARAEDRPRKRGEDYWRREAARVRDRVRGMEARAAELRARIAERAEEASRFLTRRRRSATTAAGSDATLQARLAVLERRMRQLEDELAERARREGALPGWLR